MEIGTAPIKRFARWTDKRIWEQMQHHFAGDLAWSASSSTARWPGRILAPQGAPQKRADGGQALSRSGFTTNIQVSVDGLGNPLRLILTEGQQHDVTQAESLIAGYDGEYVLADKRYDSLKFRQCIPERGMTPVIPSRSNRKEPWDYNARI